MSRYIGAIDQGTTSTRFIVFDHHGKVIGFEQKEHRQILPKPGWVEHDPLEIWDCTQYVIRQALKKLQISPAELAAIGITNQRETTILWDPDTGKPYHNAIVWQDTRTAEICNQLAASGRQDRFRPQTGLPLATYFSGPKIKWLLDQIPGLRKTAEEGRLLFGTIDTWLIWNLTGGVSDGLHITDVTNASRTILMNLETLSWEKSILDTLDIPEKILPQIMPSSMVYGYTLIDGLRVPIASDLGDQQAALFGQTCFSPGEAKNTYGTGCFMLLNTGPKIVHSKQGLLTTLGYKIADLPAVYCLEGSIAITGALVQWLRDNLNMIQSSADIETLASTVDDNGGVYFVPAFSGLFAPYWRSDARGVIVGLTRYVNRGHLARAVLEATAFQTREVLDAMNLDSGVSLTTLKVDGGMVFNELLMQFQADLLGVPVVRPQVAETTALGAAYAAGLATGYWQNLDVLRENWGIDKQWQPSMKEKRRNDLLGKWKKAVQRTLDWET